MITYMAIIFDNVVFSKVWRKPFRNQQEFDHGHSVILEATGSLDVAQTEKIVWEQLLTKSQLQLVGHRHQRIQLGYDDHSTSNKDNDHSVIITNIRNRNDVHRAYTTTSSTDNLNA
jgi:hypothetical protein